MHTEKAKHLIRYYGKVKFAAIMDMNFRTLARRMAENDWNAGHRAIIEREAHKISNILSHEDR